MAHSLEKPSIAPGGLVTVAFLKAQLDSANNHLDLFAPLILDVARSFGQSRFATYEVQEKLSELHGVAMPQQVIATLLKRAIRKGFVRKDSGGYVTTPTIQTVPLIANAKQEIIASQNRLGERLCEHASKRGLVIISPEEALDLLVRFLEIQQVDLLLGGVSGSTDIADTTYRERMVIAEFIHDIVANDQAYSSVLNGMLEGLVLYHAAFLPDLGASDRKFKNLRVAFDSSLVIQALGLVGTASQILIAETISLLKSADVQCFVFEKSVAEIRRILAFYENRLATTAGQKTIKQTAMSRHILTHRLAPSDMNELSALLIQKIQALGLVVMPMPQRRPLTTLGEKQLIERLASVDANQDEVEARVQHDVDCIAGVITLRNDHESNSLEDSRAIFAADQPLVIRNVVLWWRDDEKQLGLEPIAHLRALANLAWLKKPALSANFKIRELVSVCSAALRPDRETWRRFLAHLEKLRRSNSLTEEEATAIIISATSDKLLLEAQIMEHDEPEAITYNEIIARVKEQYSEEAEASKLALIAEHEARMLALTEERDRAIASERRSYEAIEARKVVAKNRAETCAKYIGRSAMWLVNLVLAIAVFAILREHFVNEQITRLTTWISLAAIATFYVLEATVLRQHLRQLVRRVEDNLASKLSSLL